MTTRAVLLVVSLLAAACDHGSARVSVPVVADKATEAYDAQAATDAAERRWCAAQAAAVEESRRRSLEQEKLKQQRQLMDAIRRHWNFVVQHAAGALVRVADVLQFLQQCRSVVATLRVGNQVVRLIHSGTEIVDIRTGAMAAITGDKDAWTVALNGAAPLVLRRGETAWLGWSTDMRPVTILAVDAVELERVSR